MYCVKCRRSIKETEKYKQAICGSKKIGVGLVNKIISNIGEMHLPADQGENVPGGSFNNTKKYSYCGPGTKYNQRDQEGYQGINELDKMCKLHDKFYSENPDVKSRNVSDIALAHRAQEIANDPNYNSSQRYMANLVEKIMEIKARFGLGLNSKNL
jgi:hypothetical protein